MIHEVRIWIRRFTNPFAKISDLHQVIAINTLNQKFHESNDLRSKVLIWKIYEPASKFRFK